MIARLAVWALGIAMLAGIVHIVVVLGVPAVGRGRATKVPVGPSRAMAQATCRFELDAAPVRIRVAAPDVYWSLSLYDRQGLHVWGLDNRGSGQKAADVLVAGDVHVAQLRENPPEQLEDVVIVDWKGRQGIALFQIFRQQPSLDGEIKAALDAAECKATPLQ